MATTTSLYTSLAAATGVNSNNFTTLYNSSGGDIIPQLPYGNSNVEAFLNVGTDGGNTVENIKANGTIYSNSSISASGNINVGTDLNVTGESNLGDVSNVHIEGGILNYVLSTDGSGNLSWIEQSIVTPPTPTPYIHFDVGTTANNQSFSNSYINSYGSNTYINLFKNGVNIEPAYFVKTNDTTVQVNLLLNAGDTIDILASDASTGSVTPPAGSTYDIQFNGGSVFAGDNNFTYHTGGQLLSVGNIIGNITSSNVVSNAVHANYLFGDGGNISNITAANITGAISFATHATVADTANAVVGANVLGYVANASHATIADSANVANYANYAGNVVNSNQPNITHLGTLTSVAVSGTSNLNDVSNVKIGGGFANYYLKTDGSGNLSWSAVSGGGNGGSPGGSNTYVQFNDGGVFGGDSGLTFNKTYKQLSVYYISGNGAGLTNLAGPNVNGQVNYAAFANSVAGANVSGDVSGSNHANIADVANSVSAANITGTVNLANFATTANSVAGANVSGQVSYAAIANSVAGANVSGAVTYATTANSVAGANVSGAVTYATTANAVAGANVSGAVAYATTANAVAGANVSGAVAYATTANSVAGANVTGAINLATYATTANSVAGANVTGAVNLATYATTANAVAGANVSGAVAYATAANSVAGANVSGQVANALVAGTVYTAAQPNITSTGSLVNLTVVGNAAANVVRTDNLQYANGSDWTFPGTYSNSNVNSFMPSYAGTLSPSIITVVQGSAKTVAEPVNIVSSSPTATQIIDVLTSTIYFFNLPIAQNTTINFRGSSIVTMNGLLSIGQSMTIGIIIVNHTTPGYVINTIQIDGTAQTVHWQGSTPIPATTGLDCYVFTIIKSASNVFTVIGNRGTTT